MRNVALRAALAASAATLFVIPPLGASSDAPTEPEKQETEQLREEVEALRERLSRLEALLDNRAGSETQAAPAGETATGFTEPSATGAGSQEPAYTRFPPASGGGGPAQAAPIGIATTGGQPLSITGLLDTYYTENFNNPGDGTNTLFFTNPNSRGFGLSQAKLEIEAQGEGPIGFRSDIWFGSSARLFREGLEPGPLEDVLFLQQAYGFYQFDNGAQLDVGLFGTIAGLEVAESHLNWNYSRGILWAWNEPFSHLGARFSMPLTDSLTGTFMLVNGFDNAFDNNSGKTYGVQGSWAPNERFNTTLTWIHGPTNDLVNDGWLRNISWNFYLGLHPKFEIMTNFDYISTTDPSDVASTSWGLGGYARYSFTDKLHHPHGIPPRLVYGAVLHPRRRSRSRG